MGAAIARTLKISASLPIDLGYLVGIDLVPVARRVQFLRLDRVRYDQSERHVILRQQWDELSRMLFDDIKKPG